MAVAAAVVAALLRRQGGSVAVIARVAIGIALVAPSIGWHVHRLQAGEVPDLARRHAVVATVLELVRDPTPSSQGTGLVVIDATALRVDDRGWRDVDAPVLALARGDSWTGLLPGQLVEVSAGFSPPRAGDDVAAVVNLVGPRSLLGRPPWWQRAAGQARSALRASCATLSPDPRGLLPSLVDGDTSAVPVELRTDMQSTGLSHLEAVSGENLGIVLAVVLAASRGAGLRRRWRVAAAAIAVVGFVVLARPSPSVQRAAVMSAVTLLAMLTGRRAAARSTLAAAVVVLVAVNPFLARSVGFVLSVSATAGIVVLAPAWTSRLETRLPRPLALAVAVSAAAQLACTPILIVGFGQLTPYAIPANVVAAPAVVPATILGVAAAVVGPVLPGVGGALAWAGGLPTAAVADVAHGFADLPAAATTLAGPAAYLAAGVAALVLWRVARRAEAGVAHEIL